MNANATVNNQQSSVFSCNSVVKRNNSIHPHARLVIVLLFMSPLLASAQSGPGKNEALMVQADTLLGRQDYAGALPLLNKIIEKSKLATDADYEAVYKRAFCYYGLGRFEDALTDVNEVVKKSPNDQARLLRAYINQELENYEAQLEDLNAFIASSPGNPDLLRWRASVFMETEQYDEARRDIAKLLEYQESPDLKTYLGLIYYYKDNPDSALAIFDEVIARNPEYLQPYLYAASLTLEEEAYELAVNYINAGLEIESDNITLLFYKGIALIESDKQAEGCRCLTKAFAGGMDDAGDYLKSYCYNKE